MINRVSCACLDCFGQAEDEEFDLSGIDGLAIREEFDGLNEYLRGQSNSESCDHEQSMKNLMKRYKKDYTILFFTKPKTLKAYKLFLSLNDLPKTTKCNAEGFAIIEKNLAALNDRPLSKDKLRCIDEIFLNYLKQHADICADIYPRILDKKLNIVDKEKLERVSRFADEGITRYTSNSFNNNKSKSPVQRLFYLVDSQPNFRPTYIYSLLQDQLRGKPEERFLIPIVDGESGKILLNRQKFEQLFKEYLLQPCEYFERHFGADLFGLASHELQYHKIYENNEDFYRNWARYRICANFNKDAKDIMGKTFRFVANNPKAYIPALS